MDFPEYRQRVVQEANSPQVALLKENLRTSQGYPHGCGRGFRYRFTAMPVHASLASTYDLYAIAGHGTTLDKALGIMDWISQKTFYSGYSDLYPSPVEQIIEYAFDKGWEGAINCTNKAVLLSECLLSVGIRAVPVFLENRVLNVESELFDRANVHVVVHVYLDEEARWVMLDPSLNAYFADEHGRVLDLLELAEYRRKNINLSLQRYAFNGDPSFFRQEYPDLFFSRACSFFPYGAAMSPPKEPLGWTTSS